VTAPTRGELVEHLITTRIAGDVATPRENNLDHFRSLAIGDPYYQFGMNFSGRWRFSEVLELMAKRVGVVADPAHRVGQDTIDPDRTVDALEEMGDRIAGALRRGGARIAIATGHPTGVFSIHLAVARFVTAHGARLVGAAEGWSYVGGPRRRHRKIRYVEGVALLMEGGSLIHTHDPDPMQAILAEERPDFVIADHGWAGAAGEAGIETVGFADCNDPALFVGEAEGKIAVSVPLDDNVEPRYYGPLTAYLLERVGRGL
jgi:hypothetical protein